MLVTRMPKLAAFVVIALVVSCGPVGDDANDSSLNVINGRTIGEEEYPAVYSIGGCTATFVSDSTLITAGHCVTPGGTVTLRNRSSARSLKIIRNPAYTGIGRDDLAIVLFAPGTASKWMPIQKQRVASNDDVTLVGYGCTLSSGRSGIKRIGTNSISSTTSGVLGLSRGSTSPESGVESTLCPGDSGGPLFKSNTLVGIASFWDGGSGTSSGHADVTHPANQEFLQKTIEQGAKINFADGDSQGQSADVFLALGQPEGDAAKLVTSTPKTATKVRYCKIAATEACTSSTPGAVESNARRVVGERAIFDFAEKLVIGDKTSVVVVAIDASGNSLLSAAFQVAK